MGWMEHTHTHIKYSDRESKGFRLGRLLFIKFKESLRGMIELWMVEQSERKMKWFWIKFT